MSSTKPATSGPWSVIGADANGLAVVGASYVYGKTDQDGDGYPVEVDCLDTNANVNMPVDEVSGQDSGRSISWRHMPSAPWCLSSVAIIFR